MIFAESFDEQLQGARKQGLSLREPSSAFVEHVEKSFLPLHIFPDPDSRMPVSSTNG
jgi:hypothetical protein